MTKKMSEFWAKDLVRRYRRATAVGSSVAILLCVIQPSMAAPGSEISFKGICNASAGVALTDDLFVVADDEDEVVKDGQTLKPLPFRVYSLRRPGKPIIIGELPGRLFEPMLKIDVSGELDIEASAFLQGVFFWIGSHSAGKGGTESPNRRRLFAVNFHLQNDQLSVMLIGQPYKMLLDDLAKDSRYDQFMLQKAAKRDPKALAENRNTPGGLSIEGMTALPGGALAIGFRNPVPNGKALVATIINPMNVINGEKALFGEPILLDLGGQGIRSMDTLQGNVLVVGGPPGEPDPRSQDKGSRLPHRLYRWSGIGATTPQPLTQPDLSTLFVEGVFPVDKTLLLISDDGKRPMPVVECQEQDKAKRRFRALAVSLPLQ